MVEAGYEYPEQLALSPYVIIGTSIYIGKFQLRSWLRKHRQLLAGKKLFLFVVTGTSLHEKDKLQAYYRANMPAILRDKCQYYFVPGKLEYRKLNWVDKLVLKTGAYLARKRKGKVSLADYNGVNREHILPLLRAVKADMSFPDPFASKKTTS